jgi:HEAT repeat protein
MCRQFSLRTLCLVVPAFLAAPSPCTLRAQSPAAEDEQTLRTAGMSLDGPSLLAFFKARARTEVDRDRLRVLLRQFAAAEDRERSLATAEFLGLGPLALPVLRQAANDLDRADVAERAGRCLPWLDGPAASRLLVAAARALAVRKPEGAAACLLDYLPSTDNTEVIQEIQAALAAVAAPGGKADPALLRGLADPAGVRRAAAAVALCRAAPPQHQHVPAVHQLLHDPAPGVRLRTALALAEAGDAAAVPVLIDLLAELPAEQRRPVEELLQRLAGEWAPALGLPSEDKIGRRVRRDAWAAWWRNADGDALLALLRDHTLTAEGRIKVGGLIAQLDNTEFSTREKASRELFALGRISLPQLREAVKSRDAEVSRRARLLIDAIEREPAHHLPAAAVRLLAVRKPAGCVEALVAYLPFAENDILAGEVQKSLTVLARRQGELDTVLLRCLGDANAVVRATAGQALIEGGGPESYPAVRKLLADRDPSVRLRIALSLARVKERDGVPVLIDLLAVAAGDDLGQVEDALQQLAGDAAPQVSAGEKPEERKKCRDAWAAWWKANGERVDLARLTLRPWFGYTLICDQQGQRVYELDRSGKERWSITGAGNPVDACVVPGNRVLIAEYGPDRVTERDFKGNILWTHRIPNPVNVQRLANGNTFIATQNGPLVEVDRDGKVVRSINTLPNNTFAARRTPRGGIVALTANGQCVVMDADGNQRRTFAVGPINSLGCIDLAPNGRILVAQFQRGKVVEYDSEGKVVLEVDVPNPMSATGLPNGHILVGCANTQRVVELDRSGKVVWEHTGAGNVSRARRR